MDKVVIVRKLVELAITGGVAFVISGLVAALVLWHQPRQTEPRVCEERACFMRLQNQVDDLRQRISTVETVCRF